jgi:hypothetical protein
MTVLDVPASCVCFFGKSLHCPDCQDNLGLLAGSDWIGCKDRFAARWRIPSDIRTGDLPQAERDYLQTIRRDFDRPSLRTGTPIGSFCVSLYADSGS